MGGDGAGMPNAEADELTFSDEVQRCPLAHDRIRPFLPIVGLASHASITKVEFRSVGSCSWEGMICRVEVALINLALIASTDMPLPRVLDRETLPAARLGENRHETRALFEY